MLFEVVHAATEAMETEASAGVLGTLGINWKIFIAQLINFGVVLLVLRRFVYMPLLKIMDKRGKIIAQGLEDAKKYEAKLQELEIQRRKSAERSRLEAAKIFGQAQEQAETARQTLLADAKRASEKIISEAKEASVQEKEKMLKEVKAELAEMLARALEKIIALRLDSKKDAELIKAALKKVPTDE